MKNLITILRSETKTLEDQYISLMKEWATREYNNLSTMFEMTTYQVGETLGFEWEIPTEGHAKGNPVFKNINGVSFYNSSESKELKKLQDKIFKAKYSSVIEFQDKAEKSAKQHYSNSIEKLAVRIEKKGLNENKLKSTTSHIGFNIETTLTDGEKTVRAFTIIASGVVQKPHYRYLIK